MNRLLALLLFCFPAYAAYAAPPALNFAIVDPACQQWSLSLATLSCPPPDIFPPPDPTPPPVISCSGFPKTVVMSVDVPPNGSPLVRQYSDPLPGDAALVVAFKTPPPDPIFQVGITHTGTVNGPQATRTFVLSTKPCDFTYPAGGDAILAGQATVLALKLHTMSTATTAYSQIKLEPNKVYYINMKSQAGQQICTGRCDVYVSLLNNSP